MGSDPGYVVYRPLLFFNTVMGFVYVFAAVIAWQHVKKGMILAAVIWVINLIVLVAIYYLYSSGGSVAVDSVRAMTLRTTVWFLLLVGFAWLSKKQNPE